MLRKLKRTQKIVEKKTCYQSKTMRNQNYFNRWEEIQGFGNLFY